MKIEFEDFSEFEKLLRHLAIRPLENEITLLKRQRASDREHIASLEEQNAELKIKLSQSPTAFDVDAGWRRVLEFLEKSPSVEIPSVLRPTTPEYAPISPLPASDTSDKLIGKRVRCFYENNKHLRHTNFLSTWPKVIECRVDPVTGFDVIKLEGSSSWWYRDDFGVVSPEQHVREDTDPLIGKRVRCLYGNSGHKMYSKFLDTNPRILAVKKNLESMPDSFKLGFPGNDDWWFSNDFEILEDDQASYDGQHEEETY